MSLNFEEYRGRIIDYVKRVFAIDFDEKDWVVIIKPIGISLDYRINPELWCILPFALMDDKVSWEEAIKEDIEVNIDEAKKAVIRIEKEIADLQPTLSIAKDYLEILIANK